MTPEEAKAYGLIDDIIVPSARAVGGAPRASSTVPERDGGAQWRGTPQATDAGAARPTVEVRCESCRTVVSTQPRMGRRHVRLRVAHGLGATLATYGRVGRRARRRLDRDDARGSRRRGRARPRRRCRRAGT